MEREKEQEKEDMMRKMGQEKEDMMRKMEQEKEAIKRGDGSVATPVRKIERE